MSNIVDLRPPLQVMTEPGPVLKRLNLMPEPL